MEISRALLVRCLKDERKAQFELYKVLYSPLMTVSKRYYINEDDAVTAMHNGFYKILMNLGKYRYEKSFINWCKTILINSIIDDIRSNKKRMEMEKNWDTSVQDNHITEHISNDIEMIIEREYVDEFLNCLPDATRVVFNLYVFEGFTHEDIGKRLNISAGTSKWHLSHARKSLREVIEKFKESEKKTVTDHYRILRHG